MRFVLEVSQVVVLGRFSLRLGLADLSTSLPDDKVVRWNNDDVCKSTLGNNDRLPHTPWGLFYT